MKILYVTTIGSTMGFFRNLVSDLLNRGVIVDIATNENGSRVPDCYREWGCNVYNISTSRSPFSLGNIKAVKEIRNIAKSYDIVHCHTPLAGMATRIGCRRLRKQQGVKVLYTAHGFHFYKGSPIKNWLLYYPIEMMCSKWTDVLITINKEDYSFANRKMKNPKIMYVPGVGIDVEKFCSSQVNVYQKKKELGIPNDGIVLLSVGELNYNKNHQLVIKAISHLELPNVYYLIAGDGAQKESLLKLAKDLNVKLFLLGYRNDVIDLYKIANLYILPSYREGLNVSVMEAMASGCNVLVSKIRGNIDMVSIDNCFNPKDDLALSELIRKPPVNRSSFIDCINYLKINSTMECIYMSTLKGSDDCVGD